MGEYIGNGLFVESDIVIIISYSQEDRTTSENSRAHHQSLRFKRKCILGDLAISSEVVNLAPEATIPESGYRRTECLNMSCKNQGMQRIWSIIWKKSSRIWR